MIIENEGESAHKSRSGDINLSGLRYSDSIVINI
jgi:hypothetical protein